MERPDWSTGDVVRSIRDVIGLGRVCLAEAIDKVDTMLADVMNRPEDES